MMTPDRTRRRSALRDLIQNEAAGGIVLILAAALALGVANSSAADAYFGLLHIPVAGLDVLHWINDGLMALFFLFVGLEIKREFLDGQLATWANRALPCLAAAGGVVVPGLVYLAFNADSPETLRGWAIPTATDIAFALGVLSLMGSRIPSSLKVFLATLAIVDDLVAVLIIALFYTESINLAALGGAVAALAVLVVFNRSGLRWLAPYCLVGAVLWWLVLLSGVHATVAGVALAMTIPLRRSKGAPDDVHSPLHRLEHALAPWVAFAVVPIFGFANAGVSFAGLSGAVLLEPVTLGIALGLFLGKQAGVFMASAVAIRAGLACLPAGASWAQFYGVALLCGIGFTMSIFIGLLAFPGAHQQDAVKVGVLAGSLASTLGGALILVFAKPEPAGEAR